MNLGSVIFLLILSSALSLFVGVVAWRRPLAPGSRPFAILMFAVTWWTILYALEWLLPGMEQKLWAARLEYLGIVLVPGAWLLFTLRQAGFNRRVPNLFAAALVLAAILSLLAIATNDWHRLFYIQVQLDTNTPYPMLDIEYGPLFYALIAYTYLLLLAGALLLGWRFIRASGDHRWQAAVVLLSALPPWIGSFLYLNGVQPLPHLDLTTFGLTLTGILNLAALFRFRFLDLVPVARDMVIENLADGIIVLDPLDRVVDANPTARRLLSVAPAAIVGRAVTEVLAARPDLLQQYQQASVPARPDAVAPGSVSLPVIPTFTHEVRLTPLLNTRQQIRGSVLVIHDISERRRLASLYTTLFAMTRTTDLSSLLKLLVEQATNLLDASSGDLYLCQPGSRQLQCLVSYQTEQDFTGLVLPFGEGVAGMVAATAKPLIVNDYPAWEHRAAAYASEHSFRAAMGAPLLWQGQATGVINVMRSADQAGFTDFDVQTLTIFASQAAVVVENARLLDTTQHYASELEQRVSERTAALRAANIKLQELDHMKNEFVSNISHELRTPLANIKLYLRLLETGRAEKQPQYLATLHKESALLQTLIEDLLDLSRLDMKKAPANLATADLNELVQSWVNHRAGLIAERGHRWETDLQPDLPTVNADAHRLIQVLTNLLANAIYYTPPGGLIQIITRRQVDDDKPWVTLSVRDNGPGISAEEQAAVFGRFFRGAAGRASQRPGTGLGLAICQEIAQIHGGRLTLESSVGHGSTFTFWLPAWTLGDRHSKSDDFLP